MHAKIERFAPLFLPLVLLGQIFTHLAWLPISTSVGQMAFPWLMSQGLPLFDTVIENRPPASAVLLAALFRFLPTLEPILIVRALNLGLVLALTLLVYFATQRLTGSRRAAVFAVLFWALFEPVYGNIMFYFDAVVGFLLLLVALLGMGTQRTGMIILCGLLLGLATLFKQPAWAAILLFAAWLAAQKRWRDVGALAAGAAVFPLLALTVALLQGNGENYLFWNFGRYLAGAAGSETLTGNTFRKFLLTGILAPAFILLAFRQTAANRWRWLLLSALWLGGLANLLPNFSEIYVTAHLPLLAVMSGTVIALVLPAQPRLWLKHADAAHITLAGVAAAVALSWAWIIITPYAPAPLGRARIPAYDEFVPVAERIAALRQPDDTLYAVPLLDGNAQLYPLTGMLPPHSMILGHRLFISVPGVVEKLLAEWAIRPPDLIVEFPDLYPLAGEWITPLGEFLHAHYTLLERIEAVPFNGDALIYRLNPGS